MPFYMFTARYNPAAMKAMVQHPSDREQAAREIAKSLGGLLHHFFFAMGQDDVVAIAEMPDDVSATALSMKVGASGAFSSGKLTKLLATEEAMAAMKKAGDAVYSPPTG